MVAIVGMCMIMNAAGFIIQNMSRNDKHNGKWQEPVLMVMPHLLGYKKSYAGCENQYGGKIVVVAPVSVPQ
jgi:hypothetical protein